jgi:hypothetical protein
MEDLVNEKVEKLRGCKAERLIGNRSKISHSVEF